MIGDAVERSLRSPQVLISVDELFSNAAGSRMPDVRPDLLTDEVARRVVAACPVHRSRWRNFPVRGKSHSLRCEQASADSKLGHPGPG